MSANWDKRDGTHEARIIFLNSDEFSIVVCNLFQGPEISDVHLAFVDPVVVRLDISMDVASWVHLSQCLQHFGGDISHDWVDILALGNSFLNMLLQGLIKELDDKVPSIVFSGMIIVFGDAG